MKARERDVREGGSWSPDFFSRLESVDASVVLAVEEMLKGLEASKLSKKPAARSRIQGLEVEDWTRPSDD